MRDGTSQINSSSWLQLQLIQGQKEHTVSGLLCLLRALWESEPVNQRRSRVLFLCDMGMGIYWVDKLKSPIKDDLITVTWFGDTQTLRARSCRRKDTQPPRRETCRPCFEPPYNRIPPCNNLLIKSTAAGKKADWTAGKTLYIPD